MDFCSQHARPSLIFAVTGSPGDSEGIGEESHQPVEKVQQAGASLDANTAEGFRARSQLSSMNSFVPLFTLSCHILFSCGHARAPGRDRQAGDVESTGPLGSGSSIQPHLSRSLLTVVLSLPVWKVTGWLRYSDRQTCSELAFYR